MASILGAVAHRHGERLPLKRALVDGPLMPRRRRMLSAWPGFLGADVDTDSHTAAIGKPEMSARGLAGHNHHDSTTLRRPPPLAYEAG